MHNIVRREQKKGRRKRDAWQQSHEASASSLRWADLRKDRDKDRKVSVSFVRDALLE